MGSDGSAGVGQAPWRAATAQVFVESLEDLEPSESDLHHLRRVLRLRPGEVLCAADGRGGYRMCRMSASAEPLEADGEVQLTEAAAPLLHVGFAPLKGDRTEWVVQKLTELGVDVIELVETARSVVRAGAERTERRLERRQERLGEIVRSAAAQSRRLWLPELRTNPAGAALPPGVLADAGGRPLERSDPCVLVGPEGGWTDEERSGRELVGLSTQVLRAETAAVAAATAMAGMRAGLISPARIHG
jgi:16S rRNA (uracil1498-N3)-methyltransferase